jgi:hypothetical protein
MENKPDKTGRKRLSKGGRKHFRRMKQAARKEENLNNPQPRPALPQPDRAPKKHDQAE